MAGKCTNPEINSYMQVVGNVPESQPELSEWVEEFDHEKVNIKFLNFEHLLDDTFFETFSKKVEEYVSEQKHLVSSTKKKQTAITATRATATTITFSKIFSTIKKLEEIATILRPYNLNGNLDDNFLSFIWFFKYFSDLL